MWVCPLWWIRQYIHDVLLTVVTKHSTKSEAKAAGLLEMLKKCFLDTTCIVEYETDKSHSIAISKSYIHTYIHTYKYTHIHIF